MEIKLIVDGMSCEHCVKRVTAAVKGLPGVTDVAVSLDDKTVAVTHDGNVRQESVKAAIEDAGYDVL